MDLRRASGPGRKLLSGSWEYLLVASRTCRNKM